MTSQRSSYAATMLPFWTARARVQSKASFPTKALVWPTTQRSVSFTGSHFTAAAAYLLTSYCCCSSALYKLLLPWKAHAHRPIWTCMSQKKTNTCTKVAADNSHGELQMRHSTTGYSKPASSRVDMLIHADPPRGCIVQVCRLTHEHLHPYGFSICNTAVATAWTIRHAAARNRRITIET